MASQQSTVKRKEKEKINLELGFLVEKNLLAVRIRSEVKSSEERTGEKVISMRYIVEQWRSGLLVVYKIIQYLKNK